MSIKLLNIQGIFVYGFALLFAGKVAEALKISQPF